MAGTIRARKAPRLDFAVTAEVIESATQRDSGHCMIAEALAAAMPNAKYISVDLATIRFSDLNAGWRYIYLTPRSAQEALLAFDQGEPIEPFTVRSLRAAQMVATGTARHARRDPGNPNNASRARLDRGDPSRSQGQVGVKVGGEPPPIGPLATGEIGRQTNVNRGKRREYGLRSYIR